MFAPFANAKSGVAMLVVFREDCRGTCAASPSTDTGKPGGTRIVGNVGDIDAQLLIVGETKKRL